MDGASGKKEYLEKGDIVFVNLDPVKGHEQGRQRPVLVVSATEFNRYIGLTWVIPITSKVKGRPDELELPAGLPVQGVLLLAQIRALDLSARPYSLACHLSDSFMDDEVLGRIIAVLKG